jgi:exodeoxyribonuclease VII large subunit
MEFPSHWPVQVFTVSQLTSRIRDCIYRQFRDVLVGGEVSNFKVYPSGHLYFTLKDDGSSLKGVMFNYYDKYPEGMIKDGAALICKGRIDVYEKRGEYRLLADEIEVRGFGLLQIRFEMLKEKLYKEGLFEPAHKKPLPLLPRHIGIVTSPVGAAIRDMLKIITGKFENMQVSIYPVRVQGDQACFEVAAGIEYFNKEEQVDVIIVGRGGGSAEDLSCFNEEIVARAIYASRIPVVSGVGHEIDSTIADFVADVRAPTPTAAADMVVRGKAELLQALKTAEQQLKRSLTKRLESARFALYRNMAELREKREFISRQRMYLDDLSNSLEQYFLDLFEEAKSKLRADVQRLDDLNPENILKRGYAIASKKRNGEILTDVARISKGEEVTIRLYKGSLDATVNCTE